MIDATRVVPRFAATSIRPALGWYPLGHPLGSFKKIASPLLTSGHFETLWLTTRVSQIDGLTTMANKEMIIRCLMERVSEHQFQAFSLEFGLAVQAVSEHDAREKLERMIEHYLRDALFGEDREHAYELLSRRASWNVYARYYVAVLTNCMKRLSSANKRKPWLTAKLVARTLN